MRFEKTLTVSAVNPIPKGKSKYCKVIVSDGTETVELRCDPAIAKQLEANHDYIIGLEYFEGIYDGRNYVSRNLLDYRDVKLNK